MLVEEKSGYERLNTLVQGHDLQPPTLLPTLLYTPTEISRYLDLFLSVHYTTLFAFMSQ